MKRFLIIIVICIAAISCSNYNGNLYRIHDKNLYGFIDSIGNVVIKPQFKYVSRFQDGVALVISDMCEVFQTYTLMAKKIIDGKLIVDTSDIKLSGGIKVQYGYINTRGKIIIDTVQIITLDKKNSCIPYSLIEDAFSEFVNDSLEFNTSIVNELLPFNKLFLYQDIHSKLWGYKNSKYETYIMPNYKYAGAFSEGLAIVNFPDTTKNILKPEAIGSYGVIDTRGNIIVPPEYVSISPYNNGFSWATTCKRPVKCV